MIKVVAAEQKHIQEACDNAKDVYKAEGHLITTCLRNYASGPTYAIILPNGRVGCIVGGILSWPGVARVWAITTVSLDQHPVGASKAVLALILNGVQYYNIHRLEMTVKADYLAGIKWAQFFGFEAEGLLRSYGQDKSDYLIFGRLS
jgi:hypothetical protein